MVLNSVCSLTIRGGELIFQGRGYSTTISYELVQNISVSDEADVFAQKYRFKPEQIKATYPQLLKQCRVVIQIDFEQVSFTIPREQADALKILIARNHERAKFRHAPTELE